MRGASQKDIVGRRLANAPKLRNPESGPIVRQVVDPRSSLETLRPGEEGGSRAARPTVA